MTSPQIKLLDRVRNRIRVKGYSIRTEKTYVSWVKRFILFHGKRHPQEMGKPEIETFLSYLAVNLNVAASTQNQAFNAILFLYNQVLNAEMPDNITAIRSKKPVRLPTVMTKEETMKVIEAMTGTHQLGLGWSFGALFCGQLVNLIGKRTASIFGGVLLVFGSALTLSFSSATSVTFCSIVLAVAGLGMGFVSIATLLLVQNSVDISNLGIATASHQFARTLGGTIGIGISGSLVTVTFLNTLEKVMSFDLRQKIDPGLFSQIQQNVEEIFRPEIQTLLSPDVQQALQEAVGQGVMPMFWAALLSSIVCLVFSVMLPASD